MNKKGMSLGDLYPAVLVIVLVGIVLGIGMYVLASTTTTISNDDIAVINESIVFTNNTGLAVATAGDCGASDYEATEVWNATTVLLVPANNYTLSSTGTLTPATTTSAFIGDTVLVSYTYSGALDQTSTSYCGALETTTDGLGTFATWIAVIVVVLAAAIVLGIVISSFGKGGAV